MTGPALLLLTTLLLWAIWPAEWLAAWYVRLETRRRQFDAKNTEMRIRNAAFARVQAKEKVALLDGGRVDLDPEERRALAHWAVSNNKRPVFTSDGLGLTYVDDVEVDADPPAVDLEQ